MYISKVSITGFRCFGDVGQEILLDQFTTFVGRNGTGKTAVLQALSKVFGVSSSDRTITRDDFFVEESKSIDDYQEREFLIDMVISFPELTSASENKTTMIPELFNQMVIDEPGVSPSCRIIFKAVYVNTGAPQGEIGTDLYWVNTLKKDYTEENLRKFRPHDRSKIQVIYIPAHRDPARQLKDLSGSYIGQFMKSIVWSSGPKDKLKTSVEEVKKSISEEKGVNVINHVIDEQWKGVNDTHFLNNPSLNFIEDDIDKLIAKGHVVFNPSADGNSKNIEHLSDGQRSLFYFSLLRTFFEINQSLKNNKKINDIEVAQAFNAEKIYQPAITIFAIEEPENHLSPHYLGKLINKFKSISLLENSQVLMTSHSTSVMGRIEPESVRHFSSKMGKSQVKNLLLPSENEREKFKFISKAIKAYPELYFSKLIVLGEGESEEVVLKHLFNVSGIPLDENYISVIPLAGRSVSSMWRLLTGLDIPFITLLDLDLGRQGGGWGRIKYVIKELLAIGVKKEDLLKVEKGILSDDKVEEMHTWKVNDQNDKNAILSWINLLESYNVYFSNPLDLDWALYNIFPSEYKSLLLESESGPNIPEASPDEYLMTAKKAVLGDETHNLDLFYENNEAFAWYRYFFLQRSKPAIHFSLISIVEDSTFLGRLDGSLNKILEKIKTLVVKND
tara:strand:+ start:133460 stop:135481 length:2022 start_codon:yes stop_codon:yes gene_type:complete